MAKTKLTPELMDRAVKLKKGGANNRDICAAVGITETTFYEWLNKPRNKDQSAFSDAMKKAEADYKNALLAIIARDARERDWKAAAWLLERKYPEEYSRRDRVQAEVQQQTKAEVEVTYFFSYSDETDGEQID